MSERFTHVEHVEVVRRSEFQRHAVLDGPERAQVVTETVPEQTGPGLVVRFQVEDVLQDEAEERAIRVQAVPTEHRARVQPAYAGEESTDVLDELGTQRPRRFQISAERVAWFSV